MLSCSRFPFQRISFGIAGLVASLALIPFVCKAAVAGRVIRLVLFAGGVCSRCLFRLYYISLGVQRAMASYTFIVRFPESAKAGGIIRRELLCSAGMLSCSRFPFQRISFGIAGLVALAALVPTALITAVAGGVICLVPFCAGGVLTGGACITGTYKHLRVSDCITAPAAVLTYVMFNDIPAIGAVPVSRIQGGSRPVNSRSPGIRGCAAIGFTGRLADSADVVW